MATAVQPAASWHPQPQEYQVSVFPDGEYLTMQVLHWWEAGQKDGTSIIIRNNGTVPIYYIYYSFFSSKVPSPPPWEKSPLILAPVSSSIPSNCGSPLTLGSSTPKVIFLPSTLMFASAIP